MALSDALPACTLGMLLAVAPVFAAAPAERAYSAQSALEPALAAIRLKNFQGAARVLEPLAAQGNANAQYLLACLYRAGLGVPADLTRERALLLAAAEARHTAAAYSLALSLHKAEPRDPQAARRWLEAAAAAGHELATRSLRRGGLPLEFLPASDLQAPSARLAAFWSAAGNDDVATLAVLAGADVMSAADAFGRDALMRAAEAGAANTLQELLRRRADTRRADHFGATALMLASASESGASVDALIRAGADVDAKDKVGNTPLMYAARAERIDNIKPLLVAMASTGKLNARNAEGLTALDWALRGKSIPVIQSLRAAGITATVAKREASTPAVPLRRAVKSDLYAGWSDLAVGATRPASGLLTTLLATPRADAWTAQDLRTALGNAVMTGNADAAENLLARTRNAGDAAVAPQWFDWAIRHGDIRMVELLLPAVAKGVTAGGIEPPVLAATRARQADVLRVLLDAGFDAGAAGPSGRDALMIATRSGQLDLVALLLQHRADPTRIDDAGRSSLWYAAQLGFTEGVRQLMRPENRDREDKQGISPLSIAASEGRTDVVALLVANGAAANATGRNSMPPLLMAAANGHASTVQRLLAAGANANVTGAFGNTALIVATRNGHVPVVRLLLGAGANRQLRNSDGNSASDLADALDNAELEALLKSG